MLVEEFENYVKYFPRRIRKAYESKDLNLIKSIFYNSISKCECSFEVRTIAEILEEELNNLRISHQNVSL